ncbi:hypothetical protein [Streptomyces sp. E5N91]|uniref:hypothetical protein n=1 Tax=Streptomyces sp. E5N91 TaxID=1851996 RepID=UPI000EF5BAB2|nr:hypothetical protein [Streptomyces sp. E5N91]
MRESIPFEQIAKFLNELGVTAEETASVEITPSKVTVHQFRLNEHGARYAVDGILAMVATDVPVERGSSDGADEA